MKIIQFLEEDFSVGQFLEEQNMSIWNATCLEGFCHTRNQIKSLKSCFSLKMAENH